jgi:hypothetical protein
MTKFTNLSILKLFKLEPVEIRCILNLRHPVLDTGSRFFRDVALYSETPHQVRSDENELFCIQFQQPIKFVLFPHLLFIKSRFRVKSVKSQKLTI